MHIALFSMGDTHCNILGLLVQVICCIVCSYDLTIQVKTLISMCDGDWCEWLFKISVAESLAEGWVLMAVALPLI